jgi:hypothetical protein
MIANLLIAWLLMGFCVAVHAGGVTTMTRWLRRHPLASLGFSATTWTFVRIAGWIIVMHLVEVSAWAAVYAWSGAMPGLHAAFYFSSVTYTTKGYGDLVLPDSWRLVGGIEALTGILMCGWSTGFFFALGSRL